MKVKKAYLYSAIALLLVATSVFFTIFGNNGKAYNYAKKDLSKYVSGLVYEGINIDGVEWEQIAADKSDVHAKIAALLKAAVMKNNSNKLPAATKGTINAYDIAVFNYYGVYNDGEKDVIFTAGSTMNPNLGSDFQIFANAEANKLFAEDLNKLVSDALNNKNVVDFSYNYQTTGYLHVNDVVYISYTTTAEGATEQPNVRIDLNDGEAAIDAKYGQGFYAKLLATPIGQKLKATTEAPLTYGEKSYSTLSINWSIRDSYNKASASFIENDVIFAIVTYKDANSKTEFALRIVKGADNNTFTYDAYNLTRGEIVLSDSTTKVPDEVIKRICASVINGSGTVEYAPVDDAAAKWGEGDHYVWVEDAYVLVNKEEVTAPKKDGIYYTKDGDNYVKCAADLAAWADGVDYYTLTKAHYGKVDKTTVTAPVDGVEYFVAIGEYTYNVKSIVREGATEDIKAAFKGIEIAYKYADDATDKAQDGTELKGKEVVFHIFATGVREMNTTYANISSISGGFDSLDAKKLVAIKTALNSYDTTLKAVNDLFGTSNKELVETYVAAFKAYRADASDANKAPYETAYNALVAIEISGKTEENKKETITKFETAYDALQNAVAVYYSEKVATDINNANKAYTDALAALNTYFGEANAATVEAYIAALVAVRADKDNEEKKAAYDAAKAALVAVAVEGKETAENEAAVATFEAAYDALVAVVTNSYTAMDKAIEVSAALVVAKEALSAFGDEDLVDSYISYWLTYQASNTDANKTYYESAYNALVALEVEGKDEAAKKALLKAYEDAYAALAKEAKVSAPHVVVKWLDSEAFEVLLADAEEDLKAEYKSDYINGVVEVLWETIYENVEFISLPKRAVRLAYNDQMDTYKKTYYTTEYKNYDSFKAYMTGKAFKDVDDYKAAVRKDAEEMVKEHLVVFYLADVLDIDVSEKAITADDVYAYSYMSLPEQTQTAYAFDKAFCHLLDEVYVDLLKTPRE